MIAKLIGTTFAVVCLSASLLAQKDEPDNWCRAGFFTTDSDEFRVAVATGKKNDRIYFYDDFEDDCPAKEGCRGKAYVVPGDRMIVSRSFGEFDCVWFAPLKGSPTVGWIKRKGLTFSSVPTKTPLTAWLGQWSYAGNSIKFTHSKLAGFLNVTGDALWPGRGYNANVGQLDDRAKPTGNTLKVGETETDEYACKVTMRLIGEFLVAFDNMQCGGANVTFSGVYRRRRY